MKNILLIVLVFIIGNDLKSQSIQRCHFDTYLNELESSIDFQKNKREFEEKQKRGNQQKSETVFLVPVVVHVIYKNSQENISESQILSQLTAMNLDFRKLNPDTAIVEPEFSTADSRIEFCLAKRDPLGNPTSGINRISTTLDDIGTSQQYFIIQPAWDRDHYLNIWVGDYGTDGQGNDILGSATPPGDPNVNKDGVFINYKAFGTQGTVVSPYNKGRTTTHEIGHWLGLYHIWGINTVSCLDDDQVTDTPNQGQIYFDDCANNPRSSCGSKDMLSNYMGYADDVCMGNFTEGQKDRMRNALVLQRPSLLLSKGCLPVGIEEKAMELEVRVYPNPVNTLLQIEIGNDMPLGELSCILYDVSGKIRLQQRFPVKERNTNLKLDTHTLKEGIYFLEIRSKSRIYRSKLIVQH